MSKKSTKPKGKALFDPKKYVKQGITEEAVLRLKAGFNRLDANNEGVVSI